MRGRRGQFFLLAGIIISVVIIGFAAVSNYAQQKTPIRLYDVGDELGIESGKVLDFGISQGNQVLDEQGNPVDIIDHFTERYDQYAGEDREIFFIFGNFEGITLVTYSQIITGTIGITGTNPIEIPIVGNEPVKKTFTPDESGMVSITIGDNTYDFELKPGENFFFIISQQIGEETVVVTN